MRGPPNRTAFPATFKNEDTSDEDTSDEDTSDEDTADAEHEEDLFAKWLAEEGEAFARLVTELEVLLSG